MSYKITTNQDECPEDPRDENFRDNLGVMYCLNSRRYRLGDKQVSQEYIEEIISKAKEDNCIYLPIYIYDHGNILISTGSLCDWDSGQIGVIVGKNSEVTEQQLKSEVSVYSSYVSGNVWKFSIVHPCGEHVDSCGGFYSEEEATEAAIEAVKDLPAVFSPGDIVECKFVKYINQKQFIVSVNGTQHLVTT